MPQFNGLSDFQEVRLQKVENSVSDIAIQSAAQAVEIKSLKNEVVSNHSHVMDKLDVISNVIGDKISKLSDSLDKTQSKEEVLKAQVNEIVTSAKVSSKIKSAVWTSFITITSGCAALLIEWFIRHK